MWDMEVSFPTKYNPINELLLAELQRALIKVKEGMYHNAWCQSMPENWTSAILYSVHNVR